MTNSKQEYDDLIKRKRQYYNAGGFDGPYAELLAEVIAKLAMLKKQDSFNEATASKTTHVGS